MITSEIVLATKLVAPEIPENLVHRTRLQLPQDPPPVILVSAPAGYGKTSLIASWIQCLQIPVAWLSLDAADNDPSRCGMHFIAAIRTVFPEFGERMAHILESPYQPSVRTVITTLLNEISELPQQFCLVLDDYHLLHEPAVHKAVIFIIENLPSQLRVIFSSRSDPPFLLAQLREQDLICEYRAADLRFTPAETEQFLNGAMQLQLPPEQIAMLETRTEGWIAGLQLAALSLQDHPAPAAFIADFAGDDRYVADFLLDEVLQRQSPAIQTFLLHTSILDRFCAPLCDFVIGSDNAGAMLSELERLNMFLVGLDQRRTWYRYHHLFASLLQNRLRLQYPDLARQLCRRASQWCKDNGLIMEAMEYAISASDFELAADLLELHRYQIFEHGQGKMALHWVRQLPEEILARRPMLCIACAWICYFLQNPPELERYHGLASRYLAGYQNASVKSTERIMLAQLALIHCCYLGYQGKLEAALAQAQDAIKVFIPGRTMYNSALGCLGVCHFVRGDTEIAIRLFEKHVDIIAGKNNLVIPMTAVLGLGRCLLLQGDTTKARRVYEYALQQCAELGKQDWPMAGKAHIGLGELAYQLNDLVEAERQLQRGVEITSAGGVHYVTAWGRLLLVLTRLAMGQTDAALEPQHERELTQRYLGRFSVEVARVSACLARVWLRQQRMDAVAQWVAAANLPTCVPLAGEHEAEYLVLVRFFIAERQMQPALELLDLLLKGAEQGKRVTVMVEILILQALALHGQGRQASASLALQRALKQAQPSKLTRLFIDEGAALGGLLRQQIKGAEGLETDFSEKLLVAFDATGEADDGNTGLDALELSKKEQRVLQCLVQGMANQEIAQALFVSPNTVKTHMRNIYSKLGVNSRLQAVERVRQLGIR